MLPSTSRVARMALAGAAIGVAISLGILALFLALMARGEAPLAAGYGTGVLSWLASAPFGLLVLNLAVVPAVDALGIAESLNRNMTLILSFGVVGNWLVLGALYGLLPRRSTSHRVPPSG